jgi:Mycobacterium 19 kDa lipoprotein antigen
MTDQPQGPGWWQAEDRKWYPPGQHPNHGAPQLPTPTQPPTIPKSPSGRIKVGFTIAALALSLVIAALVAGRVLLGTFLPGLLLVALIAIIGATVTLRSSQTAARKAVTISAIVLVVAAAVPASLKVVYPVYHHFFNDETSQASPSQQASPSAPALPSSQAGPETCPQGLVYNPATSTCVDKRIFNTPKPRKTDAPPPASETQYKIVVGGQTPDLGAACGNSACRPRVVCPGPESSPVASTTERDVNISSAGGNRALATVTTDNPPKMVRVFFEWNDGRPEIWKTEKSDTASVTKSGNAYTITGTITPVTPAPFTTDRNADEYEPKGAPVPFEFDATCPG